jgi:Leucine-rich repeat (LRR) protein
MARNKRGKSERPHRRVAVKLAFLITMAGSATLVLWAAHQLHCFHLEHQARTSLEADSGLAAVCYGATAKQPPYLTLSEWGRGRLYAPVLAVTVGRASRVLQLDPHGWQQLLAFRYLERLEVSGCNLQTNLDADFSRFTHLRRLAIVETPFSAAEIRTLARLPQLEEAIFQKEQGIDGWLPSIGQLRHLRTLEIEGDVSDRGVGSLAGLETVESLSLVSNRITSNVVPTLRKLKNLKALTLSRTEIDDEGLRQLAAIEGLKELHLTESAGISDRGISFLVALGSLEGLTLESNRITSESASTLARLKNLRRLMLYKTRIDDEGLRRLAELKELAVLELRGAPITDVGGKLRFSELQYLNLQDTTLTDAGLRYISHLPKLRCLVIAGTRVTDGSIESLAAMPSLMEVYAYDTKIDQDSTKWAQLMNTLADRRASEEDRVLQRHAGSRPE